MFDSKRIFAICHPNCNDNCDCIPHSISHTAANRHPYSHRGTILPQCHRLFR